jgi:hypothetical protein
MTSWFWTACGAAAADGFWHPTQSKHRGILSAVNQERCRWIRFCLLDRRLPRVLLCGEGRCWSWARLRYAPGPAHAWGRLAARPQLVFPVDLAPARCLRPGPPTPPPAFLPCWSLPRVHFHRRRSRRYRSPVRRPSASWWQPEGAHCLLIAPGLRCGAGCVACRVCVSACPWRLPADPTATPRQPNRPITPWKR